MMFEKQRKSQLYQSCSTRNSHVMVVVTESIHLKTR